MAPSRTKKWSAELKAGFRKRIQDKQINPERSDPQYIEKIRLRYYPDRPKETFRNNYKTSIAEWRTGKAIDEYNKGKFSTCTVLSIVNERYHSPSLLVRDQQAEESYYHSSDDSDFADEASESVDSLSDFEEADRTELQDLEEDTAAHKMAPKKGTRSTTRTSKSPHKDTSVDVVATLLDTTSIASDPNFSCTYRFPFSRNKAKDGIKDIVFLEFQSVNLPTSYLRIAKVLPGGMKFAVCMAAPKWFFEEGYLRTLLGAEWNENHARVQSRDETVVQPIRMLASGLERYVMGEAQVIHLPFKCIEGDVSPHWGIWRTPGVEDITMTDPATGVATVHMQFQRTMTFRLTSVHNNAERLGAQQATVYGFAHGETP